MHIVTIGRFQSEMQIVTMELIINGPRDLRIDPGLFHLIRCQIKLILLVHLCKHRPT